jgi:hypothetical protein
MSDLGLRQDILHELEYAPSVDAENIRGRRQRRDRDLDRICWELS